MREGREGAFPWLPNPPPQTLAYTLIATKFQNSFLGLCMFTQFFWGKWFEGFVFYLFREIFPRIKDWKRYSYMLVSKVAYHKRRDSVLKLRKHFRHKFPVRSCLRRGRQVLSLQIKFSILFQKASCCHLHSGKAKQSVYQIVSFDH